MAMKLACAILGPIAAVALLIGVSEARPQHPAVTARFGAGPAEVSFGPGAAVVRHDGEEYMDDSGAIYLYEEILYEDGSPAVKVSPSPWQFVPQFAPAPAVVQPVPCTLTTQSASLQGNATAGTVHGEASVLCGRNGAGDAPCDQVVATFRAERLELGVWRSKTYAEYRDTPGCSETCPDLYVNATINQPGVYRFTFSGFDGKTNLELWPALVIYMQYPS